MKTIVFCVLASLLLLSCMAFHSKFNIRVEKRNKEYVTVKVLGLEFRHVVVGSGVVIGEESIEAAKRWCEVMSQTSLGPPHREFFKQELNDLRRLRIRSSFEEEGIHYDQVLAYANAWHRLLHFVQSPST